VASTDREAGTTMTTQFALERRHPYRYADRPTFWRSYKEGKVASLIDEATSQGKQSVVFLASGRDAEHRPDWHWYEDCAPWTLEKLFKKVAQAEYSLGSQKVTVYSTGNFFGEELDTLVLHKAWDDLEHQLEHKFHAEGYKLLGNTPAQTGRELISISLPYNKSYPRLDEELLDLIIHNFGQARVELFPPNHRVLRNGVYVLDGKWMYASCISHLPTGPVQHDTVDEFLGVTRKDGKLAALCPGFYCVTATVPAGWHHIGLLKAPGGEFFDETGHYPNIPGQTFTNWTTADELALAIDNGWHVPIHERIIFPHPDTDPLATWRKNLVDLRSEVDDPLLQAAIRSIVLHTIGSFHRYTTYEERTALRSQMSPDQIPIGSQLLVSHPRELRWIEKVPLASADRQKFVRPEWSATVWGRARRRLAEFALQLPYGDIVCLMTDCVWCASLPDWVPIEDNIKPGVFRLKDYIPDPWEWPTDSSSMRAAAIVRNRRYRDKLDDKEQP
jgi:hypothetical protein